MGVPSRVDFCVISALQRVGRVAGSTHFHRSEMSAKGKKMMTRIRQLLRKGTDGALSEKSDLIALRHSVEAMSMHLSVMFGEGCGLVYCVCAVAASKCAN